MKSTSIGAENGEFFNVTADELDRAIAAAQSFLAERSLVLQEAAKLKKKPPTTHTLEPSETVLSLYRELRDARREFYLLEDRMKCFRAGCNCRSARTSGYAVSRLGRGASDGSWTRRL